MTLVKKWSIGLQYKSFRQFTFYNGLVSDKASSTGPVHNSLPASQGFLLH